MLTVSSDKTSSGLQEIACPNKKVRAELLNSALTGKSLNPTDDSKVTLRGWVAFRNSVRPEGLPR